MHDILFYLILSLNYFILFVFHFCSFSFSFLPIFFSLSVYVRYLSFLGTITSHWFTQHQSGSSITISESLSSILGILFYLEDGGSIFLWNVGISLQTTWYHIPGDYNFFTFPLAACGSVHSYLLLFAVVAKVVDLMRWTVGRSVVDLREQLSSRSQGCIVAALMTSQLGSLFRNEGIFLSRLIGCQCFRCNNVVRFTQFSSLFNTNTLHCGCGRLTFTGHDLKFLHENDCTRIGS
jgi:hypothetical protein